MAQTNSAMLQFRSELISIFSVAPITSRLVESAMKLAILHGLRGYDAVQLAAATFMNRRLLRAGSPRLAFISADIDLNAAAAAQGLATDDPNAHS